MPIFSAENNVILFVRRKKKHTRLGITSGPYNILYVLALFYSKVIQV